MNWAAARQFINDDGRWHFGIGDPNAVAWIIVAAYGLAAALSFRAYLIAHAAQQRLALTDAREARNQRSLKRLWLMIAVGMVVLGINKQLDLQSLLLQVARDRAIDDGWYANRRPYQLGFIVAVVILAFTGTILLACALRHVLRRVFLAVVGLAVLICFVIIRASSFHEVDAALAVGAPLRVNAVLELTGIGLIIASASRWPGTRSTRTGNTTAKAVAGPDGVPAPRSTEPIELA